MSRTSVSREKKRARFDDPTPRSRAPRVRVLALAAAAVLILGLGAGLWAWRSGDAGRPGPLSATLGHATYPTVSGDGGVVRIPLADLDGGEARYFTYLHGDRPIEFFALLSNDGVARAAFNACYVCAASRQGFRQEGDEMVCNTCGQRFPSQRINEERGGCNPAPLDRTVEGDVMLIRVDDIVAGADLF